MNRKKKFILMIVIIAFLIILGMSNKVSAYHESTSDIGVNSSKSIGYSTMAGADNIYCVAHGQALQDPAVNYKVLCWVEIKGNKIIDYKTNSGKKVTTKDNESNAILAAILGGALTQGYGSVGNYNAAQQALYGYWNKWCSDVGSKYGCKGYGENVNQLSEQGDKKSANKFIAQAKAAAKKNEYHVKIYYLSSGIASWQKLIIVEPLENTPPDEPTPGKTEVTGYVNISGDVWEDIANSKSNTVNSKYEEGDLRVEGIKVHWKASDGTEIATATTDKNGAYKLTTTITLYNHPYGIKDKTKYDQINNSHIEFEYNGLKYTTVAYNGNLSNSDTSKGKENEKTRENLDNKFDRVENQAVYDGNQAIIKGLPNTKISDANYAEELAVSASTKDIATKLMKSAEDNNWTETKEFCIDHCEVGEGPHVVKVIKTSGQSTITVYCNGKIDINNVNNEHIDNNLIKSIKEVMGDEINTAEGSKSHYYSAGETNGPTHRDCRKSAKEIYVWNINNLNLGLVRREQPDAAITSDIEKVRVIMKNQEYTYLYGNRGIQDNEELFDYKVKFGNKYTETYSRPINPADIAYVNYNNSDDLKVYVTYNIILKNQSNTLQMTINNIVNYFDSNYTIYTGPGTSTSEGWQEATGNNNGYKIAYNSSLSGVKLQPGSKSEIIKIEFEVNQDRIKGLLENDATLYNISEIFSYTTNYGANTICAERESAEVKGKTGKQYAGLDVDSTPGNAVPGNADTYEDDTDKAPSFLLLKDPNYKTMSGIVYEDTQTTESKSNKERLGNGQKDGNEKGVENVKVELLDPSTGETAYLYYKDTSTSTGANKKPAITYSDSNGNYSFGDGKTYGVIADNYIIKYTYGNGDKGQDGNGNTIGESKINGSVINARNYKSTIITDENVKNTIQGNASDIWYLNMDTNKDMSIAVDDLKQRLEIENLKYANYENGVNMSSYSKDIKVQIEYTQQTTSKVDNNGGDFQTDFSAFDFGIMERAREDLVINKTVSKVKVTLANGQVLIEGDPRKDKINYVKAMGLKSNTDQNGREIAKFSKVDDKLITMEIDSELLQGAKLEVWYSIILTNNSEIDYEYEKDYTDIIRNQNEGTTQKLNYITRDSQANYYYYGDKNGLEIIDESANLVVDYMSEKMVCDIENTENKDWFKFDSDGTTPIDRDYLKNNGYISDKTYDVIGEQKIQVLATNVFADVKQGETKSTSMYASTILANQADNTTYDNHVEIIEISGKVARTIQEVNNDTREQVAKSYKTGNYIPKLSSLHTSDNPALEEEGLHQQDDDRVRIVVTPPTGITTYTTIYIIAAVVGAIVIAGGIVLIKKKIMKK